MGGALFNADIIKLVSVASAPVSLVIATSIFLHMITSRYVPMYDRLRALTDEYRRNPEKQERRDSIQQQIVLYDKSICITQNASSFLNCAVCSFLGTVAASAAAVIFPNMASLRLTGIITMGVGALLLFAAILFELYEVHLSRVALRIELSEFPEFRAKEFCRVSTDERVEAQHAPTN